MNWTPITSTHNDLQKNSLIAISDISRDLEKYIDPSKFRVEGIAHGLIGVSLFFYYLYKWDNQPRSLELSKKAFDLATRQTERLNGFGLLIGRSGFHWAQLHMGFNRPNLEKERLRYDISLLRSLMVPEYKSGHDIFDGLSGHAVYMAESKNDSMAVDLLIRQFKKLALIRDNNVSWSTPASSQFPNRYEVGMAHGIGGVLSGLVSVGISKSNKQGICALIQGLVNWLKPFEHDLLWDFKKEHVHADGLKFNIVSPVVAWCNGQLGLAVGLIRAGELYNIKNWTDLGRKIALKTTKLFSDSERYQRLYERYNLIPGLCHGTAGIAHTYSRLYQYTKNDQFKKASLFWLKETLKWKRDKGGIGGFGAVFMQTETEKTRGLRPDLQSQNKALKWKRDPGFIHGVSGIGLALLAASTPVSPGWDRVLLLSSVGADNV